MPAYLSMPVASAPESLDLSKLERLEDAIVVRDALHHVVSWLNLDLLVKANGPWFDQDERSETKHKQERHYQQLPVSWQWRRRDAAEFEDIIPPVADCDIPPLHRINFDALRFTEVTRVVLEGTHHLYQYSRLTCACLERVNNNDPIAVHRMMRGAAGYYNKLPPRWRW